MPSTQRGVSNLKWSILLGAVLVVTVIIVIIIVVVGATPVIVASTSAASSSSSGNPGGSPNGTGVVGAPCTGINQCVPSCFCSQSGICTRGIAELEGQACSGVNSCIFGLYCNGENMCSTGTAQATSGSCTTSAQCGFGDLCAEGICQVFEGSGTLGTCTAVPVYQVLLQPYYQLKTTLATTQGANYYPNNNPIWLACVESDGSKVAVYTWLSTVIGDLVYSRSNTNPFKPPLTPAGEGYVLVSETPSFYVYTVQVVASMQPLYRLLRSSPDAPSNQLAHTTIASTNPIINNPAWGGTVYNPDGNADVNPGGPGPAGWIGWVFTS